MVESNLVIPFAKYLSQNEHIKSVKYQINPTYFRVFINTSNPKGEVAMHNELLDLINGLPIVSESLNGPGGLPSVLDKGKVYIATNNLYVGTADQFHILRKPIVLPISGMTEQKISSLVPDITGRRLLVRYDKSRLIQYKIQFKDVSDIISARYLDLKEGSSILITDMDGLKNLSLPNDFGAQIALEDIAQFEYIYDGINRPWTSISEFRE
ncbi:MAG: hypothetical protein KJ826_17120 [Proteobacteria bacterium]|nr:hypothetical protein [Pseudomonadota bacterium]